MFLFSPVPGFDYLIPFGYYRSLKDNEIKFSNGIVYDGVVEVMASQDAIVEDCGFDDEWGGYALLQHADDLYTFYAHGEKEPDLKPRDRVSAGRAIFQSSSNGDTDIPKFYFEVRKSCDGDQVDPGAYLIPGNVAPGVLPPEQAKLKVDGVMGKETWKAFQIALKRNANFFYSGICDGVPGPLTFEAIKISLDILFNQFGVGTEEEEIVMGIQRKLQIDGFYDGPESGKFDLETVSALQRALNSSEYR